LATALLACVGGWIWSVHDHGLAVSYATEGGPTRRGRGLEAGIGGGALYLYLAPNGGSGIASGWDIYLVDGLPFYLMWRDHDDTKKCMGFFFSNQKPEPGLTLPLWIMGMPMWFPTAVFAVAFAWSMRRSRRVDPRTAFPVDVKTS
jgi:hypothetical protein